MRATWILGLVLLAGCGQPTAPSSLPPTPLKLSLQSTAWQTISDPEGHPLANDAGNLTFEFPTDGSINYLFTQSPLVEIRGTLTISLRIAATGPVVFRSLDTGPCGIPPSVRPFLWANGNGEGSFDRWWSNPRAYALAPGTTTLSVPLRPENFSSVNGKLGNENSEIRFSFEKALLNVTRLGLTFGGGCSFGHGINISGGQATFALTNFSIE